MCPATIVSVDAVKLCKQGMVSRLEWAEFYEAPSEPAEAECCCWVLSVLLITAGSVKCNDTPIKIRIVLCQILYKHETR